MQSSWARSVAKRRRRERESLTKRNGISIGTSRSNSTPRSSWPCKTPKPKVVVSATKAGRKRKREALCMDSSGAMRVVVMLARRAV